MTLRINKICWERRHSLRSGLPERPSDFLWALIPRSVGLSVCLFVGPPKITKKNYKTIQNIEIRSFCSPPFQKVRLSRMLRQYAGASLTESSSDRPRVKVKATFRGWASPLPKKKDQQCNGLATKQVELSLNWGWTKVDQNFSILNFIIICLVQKPVLCFALLLSGSYARPLTPTMARVTEYL